MYIDNMSARREAESLYDAEPRRSIARGAISDEERYMTTQDMLRILTKGSDEDIQGGVPFTATSGATVVKEGVFIKRGEHYCRKFINMLILCR